MLSGTILGILITSTLAFLGVILAPIVTKRLNRVEAAVANAEKLSGGSMELVDRLEKRLEKTEQELGKTETRCSSCLTELEDERRRSNLLYNAMLEMLPLIAADSAQTEHVRAALAAYRRSRFEQEDTTTT